MASTLCATPVDRTRRPETGEAAIVGLMIHPTARPDWVTRDMRLRVPVPAGTPRRLPDGRALAWGTLDSGERLVLAAHGDSNIETAYPWNAWRSHVVTERYATWRRRPWHTRVPISYRVVPYPWRHAIAERMCRARAKQESVFPLPPFDGGFMALREVMRRSASADSPQPTPRVCLTHDIDTTTGFRFVREIAAVEEALGLRSSWNVVPFGERVDFRVCDWLVERGFEIGLHGFCHDNRLIYLSERDLRRRMDACRGFITRYDVRGFRSPCWLRNMRLMRVLGDYVDYDCSCLDFDWLCPAGRGGVLTPVPFRFGRLVEIPTTIPFEAKMMVDGDAAGSVAYWRAKVDWLVRVRGTAVVSTHPDPHYLGNGPMMRAYGAFLAELLTAYDGRWSLPRTLADEVKSDE